MFEKNISLLLADIEEEKTLQAVRDSLDQGEDPLSLVEALRDGMSLVGERFEQKEYYLPDLIMSGEIFKEAIELITPHLSGTKTDSRGAIVMGTVQGDIHDIGKNIVSTLLKSNGYDVHDLGVDVPPAVFVEKLKETEASLLALSGLLTLAFDSMKATVESLSEAGLRDRVKVIVGGGPVDESVRAYAGADEVGKNATDAVKLADRFLAANT
jgi:methanogenic corrinoid protein MtbC1